MPEAKKEEEKTVDIDTSGPDVDIKLPEEKETVHETTEDNTKSDDASKKSSEQLDVRDSKDDKEPVQEKQEEVKETKGETLKDWELLEMPKPFSCTHCDHKTFNSINMRRHLHSDHSIFQCEICPFETKKTGQLKAHRNSTHMSALFKCHRCNYEATKKEILESHIVSKHKTKETFNWKGVEKIKRTSLR